MTPGAVDQDHSRELTTSLILELPERKSSTQLRWFGCDTEQPGSAFLHGDGDDTATTSNSPSFQSLFTDGLVVFTFTMQYDSIDDAAGDISDVMFVIHKQALLELLSSSSGADTTSDEPRHMDWSEWGPSRTRWFDVHGGSVVFSPVIWGQRVVTIRPKYDHVECRPVCVYNFNPAAVSAAASSGSSGVVTSLDPFNLNEAWDSIGSHAAFQGRVWSQLPYIKSESPFQFGRISGAVTNGDQIVLLRVSFICTQWAVI